MVFASLIFVYAFLPLCLVLYLTLRKLGVRNFIIIVFSLLFYAWGEPVYVFLMLATVAANHLFALAIDKARIKAGLTAPQTNTIMLALLIGALCVDLGLLGLFKYSGMFIDTISMLSGTALSSPTLVMPIGISFYTFQILTYLVDVYRGKVPVQQKFSLLLMYISMFPQLIAGPIVRYSDVTEALTDRKLDYRLFCSGLSRLISGLAKKAIIANTAGKIAADLLAIEGFGSLSVAGAWLGIIAYALQIYFDFSAYSDMAIGMGRMLGFRFKENFEHPYIARSASEFWRRWHISLGTFFREYVYIPLGGNRKLVYRNLLIVWALTGLWHGASWNFVLWGLFWFVFIALEKGLLRPVLEKIPTAITHIYLLFLMLMGWVIFYYTDLGAAGRFYLTLFGNASGGLVDPYTSLVFENNVLFLVIAAIGCTPIIGLARNAIGSLSLHNRSAALSIFVLRHVWLAVLLFFSTAMLVGNSYNPFIYFRF